MAKLENIVIRDIAIYHPDTIRDNQYYTKHFKSQGIEEEKSLHILEDVLGRKKRYVIEKNSGENSLTMAIKAAKNVLHKANLTGKDIDIICLTSTTQEYCIPPSSMLVHDAIDGKENSFCYDMNVACIGVAFAYEQLVRYMSTNPLIKTTLIIGSEYMTYMINPKNIMFYPALGDIAFAMILEKVPFHSGLISSAFKVDKGLLYKARGPICGYSHLLNATPEQIFCDMQGAEFDFKFIKNKILHMLKRNNLKVSDIKLFCVSQFTENIAVSIRKELQINEKNLPYIGDKYGYTGATSPFLALYDTVCSGNLQHGDYIFIWTIGYAFQEIFLLIKY